MMTLLLLLVGAYLCVLGVVSALALLGVISTWFQKFVAEKSQAQRWEDGWGPVYILGFGFLFFVGMLLWLSTYPNSASF